MLNGPLGKNIFAMPIVASGFLQLLFNAADLVVVGRYGQTNSIGAVGATTALTIILSASLTVRALTRLKDVCRLQFKYMKFYKEPLIHILKVGVPAGIQNATFSISNVVLQSGVNSFGTLTIDANSAAQSLQGFSFTVLNGFSQACVNFAGQNYGAKQFDRITKTKKHLLPVRVCKQRSAYRRRDTLGPQFVLPLP